MASRSPWSTVAERVAAAACSKLSRRMFGRTQRIALRLELGGRFPHTAMTWSVDPQAADMALQHTRSTIVNTLQIQPVPFDGRIVVRADGAVLCNVQARVDRLG